ncbi:tetratricopeptide repeat protein [Shewanella olleyana]|uniref:tetratricopeptide repeat protein n=1 Tax=Shewanella olleyana TaxID=135626 RepID=UPI00200E5E24|nr:tetratricopeptide repeat protein [Shewanella olleyana]MCL1066488.1 tetratricopeptide repeat protein [Shewanella olleyana]
MQKFILFCYALLLSFVVFPVNAEINEQREIEFIETPNQLFKRISARIQFPLSFNNRTEFEAVAESLKYRPDELQADLEILARLFLETALKADDKINKARLLTQQLESLAETPMQEAIILLLEGRIRALEDQQYKQSIILFKEALNKINNLKDNQSLNLQFILHQNLSSLHTLVKQDTQALYHYKRYREIAYRLRNDYFIALSETAIGIYYTRRNQLAKALQHHSEAYRISNRLNYPVIQAQTQFQLSRAYRDLGQWDEALKNANEAAISYQKLGRDASQSKAMTVIAMIYANQEQWNKAIDYYLNAQQLDEKNNRIISQGLNFHNIGEAYLHLNNYPSAMSYLQMANDIFKEKGIEHYLVYNELLFAQAMSEQSLWKETITHGIAALTIADSKQLADAQKEALEYLAKAYREENNYPAALEMMDRLVLMKQDTEEEPVEETLTSNLTEEKLKFEINIYQHKLSGYIESSKDQQMAIIILLAAIFILSFAWLYSLKRLNSFKQQKALLEKQVLQEPQTQLKGYHGLLKCMSDDNSPKTIALVNVKLLADLDLEFGLTEFKNITENLINQFEARLSCKVYLIKPGEFAFCFSDALAPEQTLTQISEALSFQALTINTNVPNYSELNKQKLECVLGHINLPLLANPDLRLTNELLFETVQYALAAAKSINVDHTYVSIRTLNFAPAAIFYKPLYLNLTHALQRGIIRAESNRSISEFKWPKN